MADSPEAALIAHAGLADETLEALRPWGLRTLGELADLPEERIVELRERSPESLWEIEHTLETRGLRLRFDPERAEIERAPAPSTRLHLDDWVTRLAQLCPHARGLSPEAVRAVMREAWFDLDAWEGPQKPARFKYVLGALADRLDGWLYTSDWKGSRDEAARAFECLLGLPANVLAPSASEPLEQVALDANLAARAASSGGALLYLLEPFDDDCVFACMTPSLRDALVEAGVVAACDPA